MKKVLVYTDGSCLGNPGPGGWCAILRYQGKEKIVEGNDPATTNNRMELIAIIQALKQLKEPCEVELYSDSNYIIQAFTQGWIDNWMSRNWHRKEGNKLVPVKNADLWQELITISKPHLIHWKKVEAHSGDQWNELCDRRAKKQAEEAARDSGS